MGRGDFKPLKRRGALLTTQVTDPTPSTTREGRPKLQDSILGQLGGDVGGLASLPWILQARRVYLVRRQRKVAAVLARVVSRLSLVAADWLELDNTLK